MQGPDAIAVVLWVGVLLLVAFVFTDVACGAWAEPRRLYHVSVDGEVTAHIRGDVLAVGDVYRVDLAEGAWCEVRLHRHEDRTQLELLCRDTVRDLFLFQAGEEDFVEAYWAGCLVRVEAE